ncbi:hypothetical protein [Brevibacillus reuszeri]|nr:hypothetical protein [Brevibacillus reuszeri]
MRNLQGITHLTSTVATILPQSNICGQRRRYIERIILFPFEPSIERVS